ncbi:AprI/Inh family metalloprotease inhibitor [Mesorhizobium sp. CC13]|uniref:AprI/Inh family metalloprotease inhibitor n=1 Tax=Mesorhizobium sp. CC13 TaxID=3029194 RepID=UPI0032679DD7
MSRRLRLSSLTLAFAAGLSAGGALADDLKPLDLDTLDKAEVEGFLGRPWEIRNEAGDKRCRVVLKREPTIGGMQIDVDSACAKVFPIMDEIAAWRLKEGWAIDLVDGVRQMRLRFEVPDVTYVAVQDIDGIFTIAQLPKE